MKVKTCTSLEQSKRLVKWGLSSETADMCYFPVQSIENNVHYNLLAHKEKAGFPAWSLAALLGVLPDYTLQNNDDGTVFVVCDSKKPIISDAYDNPVDACVDLIEKLSELNLL